MINIKFERVGELFCGPGGSGIGSSLSNEIINDTSVNIRHIWAADYDEDSCSTYKNNIQKFENQQFGINEEIKVYNIDLNDNSVDLSDNKMFPSIDGLIFGFPCNDFSLVGQSKGLHGNYGPLYKHGIKILKRKDNPKWFIAENVSGLASSNEGKAFKQILTEMQNAGYKLNAHKYKFEEYGIPQRRHRIIIVGIRNDIDLMYNVPRPKMNFKSAYEALKDIPADASHQELTKQSSTVIERLKHIKPGQNAWNSNLPDHLKLNVKSTKLSQIYKRLKPHEPSYTVTGSGGGGTHMYHWDKPRALTNRERARLQTFPDWFNFEGSKESVRKQIGMAIPPEGMRIICNAVISTLYGKDYDFIDSNIEIDKLINEKQSKGKN